MSAAEMDVRNKEPVYRWRWLTWRVFGLMGGAIGLIGLLVLVQELQNASTAWIVGESHWSRGREAAVRQLDNYIERGDPTDLGNARRALQIPLGDLQGRRALEQPEPDVDAARAGFARGNNSPANIDRLVFSFRYGRDLPYFREAVAQWHASDTELLALQALMEEVAQAHPSTQWSHHEREQKRALLRRIDAPLQSAARDFSEALLEGAAAVSRLTLLLSTVSIIGIAVMAVLLLRRVRRDLRDKESRFRAAFHQAAVGMLKMDVNGRIDEANDSLGRLLGYSGARLHELTLDDLVVPEDLPRQEGRIAWEQLVAGSELRLRCANGKALWARWNATRVGRGDGHDWIFAQIEDISQRHALAREVEHQASHDPLTGLINRREVERSLQQALDEVQQSHGRHALAFINLDFFKLVNDSFGHAVGDRLLRDFADNVLGNIREGDWLGRLGGDEFALLLADSSPRQARQTLTRITRSLGRTAFLQGDGLPKLTCSIGVAEVNAEVTDVNWLMSAADSACYAAKQAGGDRVHFFNENRMALDERRREGERLLRISQAISQNHLLLYAQRIHRADAPQFLHYEVLVRLRGPDEQLQGPDQFMPAVERYGMAVSLDRHVLSLLFRHLRAYPGHVQRLGLCNVNLSGQSIADPSFLTFVLEQLDRNPMLPRKLCFEITETAAISSMERALEFIDAVRRRGCQVALDDFGSGLSSFGYLRQLPADSVKIDGVFVRDLNMHPVNRLTVQAVSQIGHALDMLVVAEWVEDLDVAGQLVALGVNALQGYALHRPCPLERLMQELDEGARLPVPLSQHGGG